MKDKEEEKMIEHVLIIKGHIWGDTINVVFTDNINGIIKRQAEYHGFSSDLYLIEEHHDAVVCDVQEKDYIATWALFNIKEYNPGICLHECNHLTFYLLNRREILLCVETMEVFAYTEQWLFNQINNFYLELKENGITES